MKLEEYTAEISVSARVGGRVHELRVEPAASVLPGQTRLVLESE